MKKTLLLAGLAILVTGTAVAATTMAYQGDYSKKGRNYSVEREAQMTTAMNNGDYQAWSNLMNGKGAATKINKDNFAKFAEAWKLGQQGKTAEAAAIRKELGLGAGNGAGSGNCAGQCGRSGLNGKGTMPRGTGFIDANGDGICDNKQ
jgi:hypothetical protein